MSDTNNFETILSKSIEKDKQIIRELKQLLKDMEDIHFNCNVSKTVGTSTSAVGTAITVGSLIAAPFTGGASLLVGLGGAALSIGGGVTNIVTDAIESSKSKDTIKRIQEIVDNKTKFDDQLKTMIENFRQAVEQLGAQGISQENAVAAIFKAIVDKKIDLMQSPHEIVKAISTTAKVYHLQKCAIKSIQFWAIALPKSSFRLIAQFFNLSTKSMKTVGRAVPIASAVFTVLDIGLLIYDWNSDPPTASVINDAVKQIENELEQLRQLQKIVETFRTRTETEEDSDEECTCTEFSLKVVYLNSWSLNPYNEDRNRPNTTFGGRIAKIKKLIADNNPDIIALVETHLGERKKDKKPIDIKTEDVQQMLGLSGYQIFRCDRNQKNNSGAYSDDGLLDSGDIDLDTYHKRPGGGILVAYKPKYGVSFERYSYGCEDLLDAINSFEINWCGACQQCDQDQTPLKKFLFSVIYRRPNKTKNEDQYDFDQMNGEIVHRMIHLTTFFGDELIGFNGMSMVGDFNYDITDKVYDAIRGLNLSTDFDRTHRDGNALDHVIYYPFDLVTNTEVTQPISDHCAIVFDMCLGKTKPMSGCQVCD